MIDKASAVLVKAKVLPLLNEHMETAFKLTERNETHLKNTAFEWFIAVISHCPTDFWSQVKPRTVRKIIYNALENALQHAKLEPEQPYRLNALLVLLKF